MNKLLITPIIVSLVLVACTSAPLPEKDEVLETQEVNQFMKTGKVLEDPVHGKQVNFFYGAVSGTGGTNANGIAYIHIFADGTSTVTVNVNIALPVSGSYIAYIRDASGASRIRVGELTSIVGDVRHSVTLKTTENVSRALFVEVRREGGGDSTLVAEGTMKGAAPAK